MILPGSNYNWLKEALINHRATSFVVPESCHPESEGEREADTVSVRDRGSQKEMCSECGDYC